MSFPWYLLPVYTAFYLFCRLFIYSTIPLLRPSMASQPVSSLFVFLQSQGLLPSCLWSLRIFPSLPGARLTYFFIVMQVQHFYNSSTNNTVSSKSKLNTRSRLNLLVVFSAKVRNSFNTRVLVRLESARWYKMVEEHLSIFNLP